MSTVANENAIGTKAVIVGCACVIFSSLTPDEIRRFKNLHPEALKAVDDKNETVFTIDLNDGPGHLTSEEAVFSQVTSADGKATITILLHPEIGDPVSAVKEKLGSPLLNLIDLEKQLVPLLPELEEEEKKISLQITQM